MKSPVVLLSTLLQGCKRLEPCVNGIDRDILTIESRVKHEGDGFLTIALPALCDAFDEGLSTGKFTCPPGFKKTRGGAIPRLFSGMLCEVFDYITGTVLESPNLHIVLMMREICRMFKKLQLDDDQVEKLDRDAKMKFIKCEDACKEPLKLDSRKLYILDRVCQYILPGIDSYDPREMEFKHGPGSVAESVTPNQKWSVVLRSLDALVDHGFDWFRYLSGHGDDPISDVPLREQAKLITVPKNSRSRRTITIEPCWKQFIQQGYNTLLRDHIKKDGILRWCLDLNDQTPNQKLAIDGSRTDEWATIDLSSASDLLTEKLVRLVFRRKPNFLEGLLYGRSSELETDEGPIRLEKFAGMGNATTFPVQSVVFAVLAISALVEDKEPSYRNVARVAKSVRVFGDDIIVPTRHAHKVVEWITEAGLIVNLNKSFLKGNFKESCGVDAYLGVDVTPLYVRHHPLNISKRSPSILAHFVSLANSYFMRGHYEVADLCVRWVEEALGSRLPLVTRTTGALGLHTRHDAYEFQRWNSSLHTPQLKAYCVQPIHRKDVVSGYEALLKFFCSPAMPEDGKHLQRSPVRFRTKAVQRWVTP